MAFFYGLTNAVYTGMVRAPSSANVKSATRTLDIMEYVVSRRRPLDAREIAAALGIPVSSLSYLLGTLVERNYLVRNGRSYSPGPGLERLRALSPEFSLAETVEPLVRMLRLQLNETTSFFVRRGWRMESLVTETSEHALRYAVAVGSAAPLHGFSGGKALLAAMVDDDLDRYFAETTREAFTPRTILTEKALRAEIDDIRRSGIARSHEEHTMGILSIGRAAMIDGSVVGAVSVAIPVVRYDEAVERRVTSLLIRATDMLGVTPQVKGDELLGLHGEGAVGNSDTTALP